MKYTTIVFSALTVGLTLCPLSSAATFYGSFTTDESIGSTAILEEDIFEVDGNAIEVFVDGTTLSTSSNEDLDALYVGDDGSLYYSFSASATIGDGVGGVTSGDIVKFDPNQPVGSQFSHFLDSGFNNVNALWIEGSTLYLSVSSDDDVGSNNLSVSDDEVFTLIGGVATSVFDSAAVLGISGDSSTDVDAFAITNDGKYLFSTSSDNDFLPPGGLPGDEVNRDGGVVYIYDPANPGAFDPLSPSSIYFDGSSTFQTSVNIDALHPIPIPEPGSAVLTLLGLSVAVVLRKRVCESSGSTHSRG